MSDAPAATAPHGAPHVASAPANGPAATYRQRSARFAAERDAHARRSRQIGTARVVVFLLLIGAGLAVERVGSAPAYAALFITAAAFVTLLIVHRRVSAAEAWADALVTHNDTGLRRLARDWDALPPAEPPPEAHPYARDLDIFGHASLRQLLGPAGTATGAALLHDWLLEPAAPAVIPERQRAVRDLAGRNDLRDAAAVHAGRTQHVQRAAIDGFLEWAEGEPWLLRRRGLLLGARALTIATWAAIGLHAAGVTDGTLWFALIVTNYLVTVPVLKPLRDVYERAFARESLFRNYAPLFATLARPRYDAPLLERARAELLADGRSAHAELQRLVRLMEMSEVRRSALTYLPVQVFTMWDFHLIAALERWQLRSGRRMRRWIDAAAEIEALAALATLAHDHPDWAWPELTDAAHPVLTAEQLAHPLLRDDVRVGNDVTVGPPGSFLLVTGSNMSGKSTLLRAIGVNAVLAQAGAPVCATALRMPPLLVRTSIRVEDSIASGVSLFMAELLQMKRIVTTARELERDPQRVLLFLLDEILHGTNTAERRIAARRIIGHLLAHGAIGAITTHDLTLADDDALRAARVPVHFTETVLPAGAAAPMSFDYRLRDGLATSTNALRLMELVGLGEGSTAE